MIWLFEVYLKLCRSLCWPASPSPEPPPAAMSPVFCNDANDHHDDFNDDDLHDDGVALGSETDMSHCDISGPSTFIFP